MNSSISFMCFILIFCQEVFPFYNMFKFQNIQKSVSKINSLEKVVDDTYIKEVNNSHHIIDFKVDTIRAFVKGIFKGTFKGPTTNPDNPGVRIISGKESRSSQFPFVVQLNMLKQMICGGSIISKTCVLTAAHCTYRYRPKHLSIRAGSIIHQKGGSEINVVNAIEHSKFDMTQLDYDISVLKLGQPLTMGNAIKAIDIPSVHVIPKPGTMAIVCGWGKLKEEADLIPVKLQNVRVPIIKSELCAKWYNDRNITNRMICAGYKKGRKDACTYDSGGPLSIENKLYGIVSWGYGCARPQKPGVYTNIIHSEIRAFIKSQAGV